MNISELWETVVLRDLLGYIVPGAVTLFALALLVTQWGWTTPYVLINAVLDLNVLSTHPWPSWHPWLLAAVILPLSYVIGHLQYWPIEWIKPRIRCWNLGRIALEFLKEDEMGYEYCEAALSVLTGEHRDRFKGLCGSLKPDEPKNRTQDQDEVKAEHLWRLCDRYVLSTDSQMHATFMGRYYVLAVLFTNLGASMITLSISLALVWLSGQGAIVLSLQEPLYRLALSELLVAEAVLGGFSAILIFWSGNYRKEFVGRTFPIFYALTLERGEPSVRPEAARTGEAGAPHAKHTRKRGKGQ